MPEASWSFSRSNAHFVDRMAESKKKTTQCENEHGNQMARARGRFEPELLLPSVPQAAACLCNGVEGSKVHLVQTFYKYHLFVDRTWLTLVALPGVEDARDGKLNVSACWSQTNEYHVVCGTGRLTRGSVDRLAETSPTYRTRLRLRTSATMFVLTASFFLFRFLRK